MLLFSLLAFVLLCLIYGCYEARNIKIVEYVYSNKSVPQAFVGKKIIFISDTHCNAYFDSEDVAKLVLRINARKPDMVFLGGDHVSIDTTYSKPFFKELGKLESTYGTFFVLGNHDHWEDAEAIWDGMTYEGIHSCDNEAYWIHEEGDSIRIGGVGDLWEDEQIVENTTGSITSDNFCILLSHNPDYIEVIGDLDRSKVDLMLSGHTHGGQITFFGLWAPIMPNTLHGHSVNTGQKYRYGWGKYKGTDLYVTSGIGMGHIPFRFFAPPEIVEITLKAN